MKKILLSLCMALFLFASLPVYAAQVEPLKGIAVVDVESLNVRSGPSRDYDKLGSISQGVEVRVRGIVEPDWYVIDFDGEEGYISSDYVIFTYEDPRSEDPKDIIDMMLENVRDCTNYEIVIDRAEAIKRAIDMAEPNDLVIILGKGNENHEILKDGPIHFNDIDEAKKCLQERMKVEV